MEIHHQGQQTRYSDQLVEDWDQITDSDYFENGQPDDGDQDQDVSELFSQFESTYIETPRIFDDFHRAAAEMEHTLTNIANEVAAINRTENDRKAEGSAVSFSGGLVGIAGTLAAPFTFGGSLALTVVGACMSWTGSSLSCEAEKKLTEKTNKRLEEYGRLQKEFNNRILQWVPISVLLGEIVEELQDVFSDLSCGFGHLLKSVEGSRRDDSSPYQTECILKCFSIFYGVARTSTHVVRNVKKIAELTIKTKYIEQVILKAGNSLKACVKAGKATVLRAAIGKPQVATSVSKQVVASSGQVVTTIQKASKVSATAELTKLTVDSANNIVKTETAVKASLKTVTRETTTVTRSVCKVGLALGVVFAAVDFYEFDKAMTASKTRCDAEKELRSCIETIKASTKEIMDQLETYKQVIKIKMFFAYLLQIDGKFVFGEVDMSLEKVGCCLEKIKRLESTLESSWIGL